MIQAEQEIRMPANHTVLLRLNNFVRPELQDKLAGMLRDLSFLYPRWMRELAVVAEDADVGSAGALARGHSDLVYGTASITVYGAFFDRDDGVQYHTLVHELIHIADARRLAFMYEHVLGPMRDRNRDLHDVLHAELRKCYEDFTQFMSDVVVGRLNNTRLDTFSTDSVDWSRTLRKEPEDLSPPDPPKKPAVVELKVPSSLLDAGHRYLRVSVDWDEAVGWTGHVEPWEREDERPMPAGAEAVDAD